MLIGPGRKIYFASDFHLGLPDKSGSLKREKLICRWLDDIKKDAERLYLVGDIFDVWFEYKNVIPKGFTRFLGKLAELTDQNIKIEIFSGNHDIWMRNYFEEELAIPVHHQPITFTANDKKFFVGHGDGLGPGDRGYKLLKYLLRHPVSQWLYRRIHPDTGMHLADYFSKKGDKHFEQIAPFKGEDKEWLVVFCKRMLEKEHFDYFIFGHRHLALEHPLPQKSLYLNLGDWLNYNSYAEFDGKDLKLLYYNKKAEV
ncbi:MAG TPA: UDP-2,3-diacylglucosamine diphosphatase [Edaphocola sp.]|nr:UDP-2,3-diacylglucosamine diphosphatase [Edaphocola sp.]